MAVARTRLAACWWLEVTQDLHVSWPHLEALDGQAAAVLISQDVLLQGGHRTERKEGRMRERARHVT